MEQTVTQHTDARNAFLDASTPVALSHWDELLDLQVELFFPHELGFLRQFRPWLDAASVLDVGCGNGGFLARLKTFFPDKTYTGIDVSPQFVALASKHRHGSKLDFAVADFFAYNAPYAYDIILMRFVVQHLSDFDAILAQGARLLRRGGGLIVVEPDIAHSVNMPATPIFEDMLHRFEQCCAEHGRIRPKLADVAGLMRKADNWYLAHEGRIVVPSVGPFTGTNVLKTYMRWIDLCESSGIFPFAYDEARREVAAWAARPACFSQIALRVLHLRQPSDDRGVDWQDVDWREA